MRLLALDQFTQPGGAQQCLADLLPAMRDRGWEATVGLAGDGPLFDQVRAAGFEAVPVSCGPYGSGSKSAADVRRFVADTPRLVGQIRALAKRVGAELVYVNGPRLLPAVALANLEAPVAYHAHRVLAPGAARTACGWALRRSGARVAAVCRSVADAWRPFVGDGRVRVIYNGVRGPDGAIRRRTGRVGCIGRIAPEKGQLDFLKAAAMIHRAMPECRFVIYGAPLFSDGDYVEKVHSAAAGLPVEFAGWVSDVYQALATLDLVMAPSDEREATTRVILEAFAAGVPVIAYWAGGIPEVVEDGCTGFLCRDAEAMALRAVELLRGDETRLAAVSRAARESWERRFTLERWRREVLAWLHPTG